MAILRSAKVLYKDKLAFWLTNFSLLFILSAWSVFLFKRVKPDPLAVIHVNIYSGIDVIAGHNWLFIVPAIFLAVSILNFWLAILLWTRSRLSAYLLLSTVLFINLALFLYLFTILNYNI